MQETFGNFFKGAEINSKFTSSELTIHLIDLLFCKKKKVPENLIVT